MSNLSWDGQLVTAKYWYPKLGAIYAGEGLGEASFLANGTPFTSASGYYSFTVTALSARQERLDVTYRGTGVEFSNSLFNGPVISGLVTNTPILSAVLLSSPANGFGQTDVGYDASSVWLNDSALTFPPSAVVSVLITFDILPTAAHGVLVVGHDQTTDVTGFLQGLITPAVPTDHETITAVTGRATLSQGDITYIAPSSRPDSFDYTVADQLGHVVTGTVAVTVDSGPTLSHLTIVAPPNTTLDLTNIVKGAIVPGLPGDVVALTGATGASFNPVGQQVTFTPAAGDTHDMFDVSFNDQLQDTASGPVYVQLGHDDTAVHLSGIGNVVDAPAVDLSGSSNLGPAINGPAAGGAVIDGTRLSETITAFGAGNTVLGNGGSDTVYAGTGQAHVTVSDQDGNNAVTGLAGGSTVTLGDGDNLVDLGAFGNHINLGNGNNKISGGAGNAVVVVGNGSNTIGFSGYSNIVTLGYGSNTVDIGTGSDHVTVLGGIAKLTAHGFNDVFDIGGGTTTISGLVGYGTITLGVNFGVADSIDLAEGAGYVVKFVAGQLIVTKPDGELIATVNAPLGKTLKAVSDGAGGTKIVLSESSIVPPTPTPTPLPAPGAPTVITETTWGVTLTLAAATKTVHLAGYNNTVIGGDGDHLIDGDNGGLNLTLGSGNNVVSVNGYNDVIRLGVDAQGHFTGAGNAIVSGTSGVATIHTGAGNQTITAAGFSNVITTGDGNSVVMAGAGGDIVNTGNGTNDITAFGNTNTIITHQGTATVHLNGWTNLIEAGAGHTIVSGGYFNTYQVLSVGSAGGVEVTDFSTLFGDVLDLHPVVGTGSVSVQNGLTGDLKVFVTPVGGSAMQVADLHGMAGESVASLIAKHSLTY